MSKSPIVFVFSLAALLVAGTTQADDSSADYSRSGWYFGAGGGGGSDFLNDSVQDETGGNVDLSVGPSANARVGYRATSWFAFEIMYEGIYDTNVEVVGVDAATQNLHTVAGNFKFLLPTWRFQPYIMAGPGGQYGDFDGKGIFDGLDTTRWDFVVRTALGLDCYITENWLINFEVAPSVRFADYTDVPSQVTDNVTLTYGLGFQYRM